MVLVFISSTTGDININFTKIVLLQSQYEYGYWTYIRTFKQAVIIDNLRVSQMQMTAESGITMFIYFGTWYSIHSVGAINNQYRLNL